MYYFCIDALTVIQAFDFRLSKNYYMTKNNRLSNIFFSLAILLAGFCTVSAQDKIGRAHV